MCYTLKRKCNPSVIISPRMELSLEIYGTPWRSLQRTKIELEIQMFFELCYKIVKLNEIFCAWQPALVIR